MSLCLQGCHLGGRAMNHYNCLSGKCQKIKEGQKNRETETHFCQINISQLVGMYQKHIRFENYKTFK